LNPISRVQSKNVGSALIINEIDRAKNQKRVPKGRKDHGGMQLPIPEQPAPYFIVEFGIFVNLGLANVSLKDA
jgi:hypothetical protein